MQEVEAMCNRVIIINKGEIVTDGATVDIKKLSVNGAQKVLLATANTIDIDALKALSFISNVEKTGHNEVLVTAIDKHDIRPQLFKTAVDNGWILITLSEQSRSVENIFMELTR
jgi:ABC-2 type transport system ATP-binding protein